jgi:hypothetical protein
MRLVDTDNQKITEVTPESFILIVAGDTTEGRQCLREIMNARQAETAAIRKYLNLVEAKAQRAQAATSNGTN